MASVIKTKTGYGLKLSPGENQRRPKIALGRVSRKQAETVKMHIETLIAAQKSQRPLPPAAVQWLKAIPDGLRKRLTELGLIEKASRWTVKGWIADYIERRTDVKPATRLKWKDVQRRLNVFFGDDYLIDVTVQQAKNFRIYLKTVVGLNENTIRRYIAIARQFFNAAKDADILAKNPFAGQPVSLRANPERFFFVTPEMARKILDACPDAQWRLIFGLCRWGGLRCPSEVINLKWTDVDFEHQRFTVYSPKTEHHIGRQTRIVPMFPELRPLFQEAFEAAPEGAVYCVDRCNGRWSNLGALFAKIVKRAGLPVWPKLMQNLRSTRETELFKLTGGNIKAVCEWIGNSPLVALKHYAQVTEADMQEAAKISVLNNAENMLQARGQKKGHLMPETTGNVPQDDFQGNAITLDNCRNLQRFSKPCEMYPVGATGLEPATS